MFCKHFTWMISGIGAVFTTREKAAVYLQEYRNATLSTRDLDLVCTVDELGDHCVMGKYCKYNFPIDPVFGVDDVKEYYRPVRIRVLPMVLLVENIA